MDSKAIQQTVSDILKRNGINVVNVADQYSALALNTDTYAIPCHVLEQLNQACRAEQMACPVVTIVEVSHPHLQILLPIC